MNTAATPTPELTAYQRKLQSNLRYYHRRYLEDEEFKQREIQRNCNRIREAYANDPEFRQKMIDNAKARYYRLKEAKQQVSK